MSLARQILDEANEDIQNTEMYQNIIGYIQELVPGLQEISKQLEFVQSDTTLNDDNYFKTVEVLNKLCNELDKNGFTYFPQSTEFNKKVIKQVIDNFIEFYDSYLDGFDASDMEILNTNSKDLVSILERLR